MGLNKIGPPACTHQMTTAFTSRTRLPLWTIIILTLIALDQLIKIGVETSMPLGTSIAITSGFNWVHVINKGAAFSFLADANGWQRYFFSILGITVSAALIGWLWQGLTTRLETAACILMAGGAMGNVIDRFRLGAVTDYLDFYWRDFHWPAFNFADISIFFGALLFGLASLTDHTPNSLTTLERANDEPKIN